MNDTFLLWCLVAGLFGFIFLLSRLFQFRYWLRGHGGPATIAIEGLITTGTWIALLTLFALLNIISDFEALREPFRVILALLLVAIPWAGFARIELWIRRWRKRKRRR